MKIKIVNEIEHNIKSEEIREIIRANYFAKNTVHIIKIANDSEEKKAKENCQGTKFIYHQMVFNMIYDNFGDNRNTAKEKITNLISWLIKKGVTCEELVIILTNDDLKKLENIKIDKNITQEKKDEFLEVMKKIKNGQELSKKDLVIIFNFINKVRNNFFHGTKKAEEALNKGQEERFKIYSKFLERLADKFIEIVGKEGISLAKEVLEDDLKENLGLLKRG